MHRVVTLNVRGTVIQTRAATLAKQPGSKLAELVNPEITEFVATITDGKIFIDRNPKVFSQLLDALTEGSEIILSHALQLEAEHWGIELARARCPPRQHYLTVRREGTFAFARITNAQGQDVREMLDKAAWLDHNEVLIRYAERFNFRISNIWPDSRHDFIIVEMTRD
jgi:hypothetical protein